MVRMTVLASGSKGNSTVVSSSRTRILVDAGLSCRELFKRMQAAGEDPRTLDAILVTHEHVDHVQGLAVTARKLGIPVYFTEATHRAWARWMTPRKRVTYAEWLEQRRQQAAEELAASAEFVDEVSEDAIGEDAIREAAAEEDAVAVDTPAKTEADPARLPGVEYFTAGEAFCVGDIAVTPFTIPHDAIDPVGFVFEANGIRVGIATDLGYMPAHVEQRLKRCDVLMLESNHDLDMLRDGPYPWSVKQRVMSRVGHLSNDAAAKFLEGGYDGQAAYVVLAHLSESNNMPELARLAAERALRDRMSLLGNRLLLATQQAPLESIVL
ncbi:MBL fold metallo-hydrolase [Silvibacterium dinghuense]|uniref:MBL fold metallo-hydrolase n=1 Tax=Silvibacterium dinghuense TaxID=1560006 RepID=A0A4Q1SE27_9BACT|nr:MBL fold metallo-hydrolase [Silvibacterium dinghuense]RXS95504.1 MBL fold metallo-hydrolase [Silvibacterium dinghuense]